MRLGIVAMLLTALLLFATSVACTQETALVAPQVEPTAVKPKSVELLSLQVSKLPRDQFGKGKKPGSDFKAAFWLANSGTALYG